MRGVNALAVSVSTCALFAGCGGRSALLTGTDDTGAFTGLASTGGGTGAGGAQPFVCTDVAGAFSSVDNPSGYWSYGWWSGPPPAGSFTLYDTHENFEVTQGWHDSMLGSSAPGHPPHVYFNPTGIVQKPGGSITIQAKQFAMHPGLGGEHSVVRWVAPLSGAYSIEATFTGISNAVSTTTDVHVLTGSGALFNGGVNVNGGGPTASYGGTVALGNGEAVYFTVGFGNGAYNFDSTALAATICLEDGG